MAVALLGLLSGCASISTLTNHRPGSPDPLIFGGTRVWIANYSGENGSESWGKAQLAMAVFPPLMLIPILDTILSVIADTILLPITIPWAVAEHFSKDTISDRFEAAIRRMQRSCPTQPRNSVQTCRLMATLKPVDHLATEEGRQAASILIPNEPSSDNFYRQGMSSKEYFDHLCKAEAGEFIYRPMDHVEGILLMRPRPQTTYEFAHLYATEDPYGLWGGDGLRPEYLGGPSRYLYIETYAEAAGKTQPKYVRYVLEQHQASWQMKPLEHDDKLRSQYGFTWRGIKRPHDRELGIAGSEVIAMDLKTHEVLGVFRGYARFDFTQHSNDKLGMGWVERCPNPTTTPQQFPQREFLYKVLHP